MKKIFVAAIFVCCFSLVAFAQPRPIEKEKPAKAKPLPESFEARYEGGMFGNSRKEDGTLKFDDINERIVFYNKEKKELYSIPYPSLLVIYPDSKTSVSKTGNVVSHIPLPGAGLAGLITTSTKYLIVTYDDPDIDIRGTANFKFDDRDLLLTFINALGEKAKMLQRGEAYYRPKKPVY